MKKILMFMALVLCVNVANADGNLKYSTYWLTYSTGMQKAYIEAYLAAILNEACIYGMWQEQSNGKLAARRYAMARYWQDGRVEELTNLITFVCRHDNDDRNRTLGEIIDQVAFQDSYHYWVVNRVIHNRSYFVSGF
jgi:hypothetical protein